MQKVSRVPGASSAPWSSRSLSEGAKVGLLVVCALLLIVLLVSSLLVVASISQLRRADALSNTTTADLVGGVVSAILALGSLAGLIMLWPKTRAATRFTPQYGTLLPTIMGHPFEVRFRRSLASRSLRGAGTVQFTDAGITYTGHLEPSALFQLGVVVVLTVVPFILFRVALGIIPALLLAYYVGRKQVNETIPYDHLQDFQVTENRVTIRRGGVPKQLSFTVADVDGERLYREILPRVPAALGGWTGASALTGLPREDASRGAA